MLDDKDYLSQKDRHKTVDSYIEDIQQDNNALYKQYAHVWTTATAKAQNQAKQVAMENMGRLVIIYATPEVYEAALVWKQQLSQVAHNLVFCEVVDEDNPAILAAWRSQPVQKPFGVIVLTSTAATKNYRKALHHLQQKLSGLWPDPIVIESEFEHPVTHLSELAIVSSKYSAMLNQVRLPKD